MCGIFALIETSSIKPTDDNREQVFQKYKSQLNQQHLNYYIEDQIQMAII